MNDQELQGIINRIQEQLTNIYQAYENDNLKFKDLNISMHDGFMIENDLGSIESLASLIKLQLFDK
jgi:hypothetical protein